MNALKPPAARAVRFAARVIGVFAAVLPISSCYLLNQGTALLRYQSAAEPVDELIERGRFADGTPLAGETRAFLEEVKRIRAFSATLGLAASDNYASLVPTDRSHLADVVNATSELSFDRHLWWWPFVGRLPYKGYYDPGDAVRLASRLRNRGLDVWVRPVDAFSTLGVLKDPLYQFMTGYDRHRIANLIIHEQAHATLFLRGHSQFNEEFATFVGDVGAALYLEFEGGGSEELQRVRAREADQETVRRLMLSLRAELSDIYRSESGNDEKRNAKAQTIGAFRDRVRDEYESIFRTDSFRGLAEVPINNAYIDLYVSYTEDLDMFRTLYDSTGRNLQSFLRALSVLSDPRRISNRQARRLARTDPKAYIRTHLLDSADGASLE